MDASLKDEDFETYLARIHRFTHDRLIPAESQVEAEDAIPPGIVEEMREIGLFGISIPEAYGGLAFNMEQQVQLTFAFTQAAAAFRSRFSTTIGLCSQALLDFATEEQKRKYLPAMASGACTGAFALTEPEAGSDAGSLQTRADRDGDGYVLNGHKRYITNAPEADMFLVMARTDGSSRGSAGISAFAIDSGTPGIEILPPPKMLGLRGSRSTEILFRDCRVGAETLVGGVEGGGLKTALRGINHARLHVAATCVGQAIRLIEESIAHLGRRHQFDRPIAEFQSLRNMLADARADAFAARSMTLDCARRFDRGEIPFADIACAKYFASEMVCRVADRAVQMHGGAGFMEENAVTRLYRDVRLFRLFEGTSQIQQNQIARDMLRSGRALD